MQKILISEKGKNKSFLKEILLLSPIFLFFILLTVLVSKNIFFWDTIQLGSSHALFFYENNFSSILLPDHIDSGHIPSFGIYLALSWLILGKNLIVSHFAMLPFLFGIVWQTNILVKRFIQPKYSYLALTLILADATLLAQATLVSPDIILSFLFLLGLNSIFSNKKLLLSISVIFLFLISMRGMMVSIAILLIDIVLNIKFKDIKTTFINLTKRSLIYLPALFIFISFNFFHYKMKGWFGYHSDSPWQKSFEFVDFEGFIRNLIILAWRLVDFGRIFVILPIIIIFLILPKKNLFKDKKFTSILLILFFTVFSLSVTFLIYNSLTGHRYLLPIYLIISLLSAYLIFEKIKIERLKYIIFTILILGLLSGNLWIYPKKISQGWDSTLAHLHYYKIRKKMVKYLNEEKIDFTNVGSAFPNLSEQKYLDLSDDTTAFVNKNLELNKYILFSNIFNDFSDKEIDDLQNKFILKKEFNSFGVFMQLYEKKRE